LVFAGPIIHPSFFYPKPHRLPAIVNQIAEGLPARLDSLLKKNAPIVAQSLQADLSDGVLFSYFAGSGSKSQYIRDIMERGHRAGVGVMIYTHQGKTQSPEKFS